MFFRRIIPLGFVAAIVLLAACGADAKKPAAPKTIDDYFALKLGDRTVRVQIALSRPEMQRGLMHRKSLGTDEGMVFVHERPQLLAFWMRNTELPLDIGYFDPDGTLREVYQLLPHDERPVQSIGRRQIALEMNRGWFSRAGMKPGAQLDMAALREAMQARGVDPRPYALP
jgi:uncharacterized membrane protein (UPF0127 family)